MPENEEIKWMHEMTAKMNEEIGNFQNEEGKDGKHNPPSLSDLKVLLSVTVEETAECASRERVAAMSRA